MEKNSALHEGHRARLRERFLMDPGALADHELLELLLFYAIPRRDTNDLAHTLIEEFGSLLGVIEADAERLSGVVGVKGSTVAYIKAICETARRFMGEKMNGRDTSAVFDTPERIASFIWPRFLGQKEERVYALLFDNGMRLLDCYHVCDGSVSGAPFSVRRIVQRAYAKGAVGVVLAHNHPGGMAVPSGDDIRATRQLEEALRLMEIPLIEHYIFSDSAFTPIMSQCRVGEEQEYVASSLQRVLKKRLHEIREIEE
ncbi:MAG: DNA repair protein RadC [Clostridia bacterium]|nr:DNA repair protein RadC [Clostridia bacterium]